MNRSEDYMAAQTDDPPPVAPSYEVPALAADPGVQSPAQVVPPRARGVVRGAARKSVFLACCLSLLPGIGQAYVGYYKLGFIHNVVFAGTIMLLVAGPPETLATFLGIFLAFFFVYNIVDAGRRAGFYNMVVDGAEDVELPDDMNIALPSFGGSIGGGIALIVVGSVLLSNTVFGVSLAWVEDWWPVVPIGLGGYLVWKARQDQRVQD